MTDKGSPTVPPTAHLWYGSPRRMVPARYSCSASMRRASSCGSVQGASWMHARRPRRIESASPYAPPMTNATSRARSRAAADQRARTPRRSARRRSSSQTKTARAGRQPLGEPLAFPSRICSGRYSPPARLANLGDVQRPVARARGSRNRQSPPRDADHAASRRRRRRLSRTIRRRCRAADARWRRG